MAIPFTSKLHDGLLALDTQSQFDDHLLLDRSDATMDVGDWLRMLGLDQYEAVFRENEIDADVLPELTDQHLKDLGVSLGHRLKILRAMRELAANAPINAQRPAPAEPKHHLAAERRQLTVMFCDLVGSTTLSARLDPEDMGDLIRAFQGVVAAAVSRFDGHVAKLIMAARPAGTANRRH
jgi:hypothetical protein